MERKWDSNPAPCCPLHHTAATSPDPCALLFLFSAGYEKCNWIKMKKTFSVLSCFSTSLGIMAQWSGIHGSDTFMYSISLVWNTFFTPAEEMWQNVFFFSAFLCFSECVEGGLYVIYKRRTLSEMSGWWIHEIKKNYTGLELISLGKDA